MQRRSDGSSRATVRCYFVFVVTGVARSVQPIHVAAVAAGFALAVVLPGFAAARFLVGTRHPFDLAWQTVLGSLLVFTPLAYPAALAAGAPTVIAVAPPLVAFAVVCWIIGRRRRGPSLAHAVGSSPRWLWIACAAWLVLDLRIGAIHRWCPSGDVPWFVGTMRELAQKTPAENPELAGHLLSLPSGYWFWYASVQRFTGLDTSTVLFGVGALVSIVLFVVVHRASRLVWRDDLAAALSVVLLLIPCDAGWLRPLTARGAGSMTALFDSEYFGYTLAIAWYHGPALILVVLVLAALIVAVRTKGAAPIGAMLALLVVFPFHHPMYYGVTLCGIAPYVLWKVRARALPWPALLAVVTWLPWKLVAWAWPEAMLHGDIRFDQDIADVAPHLGMTLLRHALLLPLAWVGWRRVGSEGKGVLLSMLVVTLLPGPWAGWNRGGWNPHWQWSPVLVVLALLAGAGAAALVRMRDWRTLLLVMWLFPNVPLVFRVHPWDWLLFRPDAAPACRTNPDLLAAATFLRTSSAPSAVVATPPESAEGGYVEMHGARRLVFGRDSHFDYADPAGDWQPARKDMERLFDSPSSAEASAILERRHIDFVVARCPTGNCADRFPAFQRLPVAFRSDGVVVLGASRHGVSD